MPGKEEKPQDNTTEQKNKDKEQKKNDNIIIDDEDHDYRCGYFSWTPQWLQRFNTPRWLLVTVMILTFSQGNIYLPPPRLFLLALVCLLAVLLGELVMDFNEMFRMAWQWCKEQFIKLWGLFWP